MADLSPEKTLDFIENMRDLINEFEIRTKNKEWYDRNDFARFQGLKPHTVSNYLTEGKYGKFQRKKDGHWQIHKSQLKNK
jgi:hypothetical protein